MPTYTAIITVLHNDQGYGYVRIPDTAESFRFRLKDWEGEGLPQVGQLVRFILQQNRKGYFASDLKPANFA
ncbi:MAG: hypothetical protein AAF433_13240 [Bacteroidota bacterium]